MKINYSNYNGESKFVINGFNKQFSLPMQYADKILKEYKNPDMDKYLELIEQERLIIQQKKGILSDIKKDFNNYLEKQYPEYFI